MSKILIFGGRAFRDEAGLFGYLDDQAILFPISCVVTGAASGADCLAKTDATSGLISSNCTCPYGSKMGSFLYGNR